MADVKAQEQATLEFFEALLRLEYPDRRVSVTPAPFFDEVSEEAVARVDGSGVLDVVVGPLDDDPSWAAFRCTVQFEVALRDWPGAARVLLDLAGLAFRNFRARSGEPLALYNAELLAVLQEVARRANWDAKCGPQHLRTGRFVPEAPKDKKPG